MASQLELSARAALCRQLAKREPTNRVLWMAEAENWSRLSNEKLRGEAEQKWGPHLGEFAGAFRKIVYQSRRSKSRAKRGRECTAHRTQLLKVLSRASAPNNLRPPVLHCRLALSCPPAWQASYRQQRRLGQFWINSRRAECRQLHTLSGKESQQMTPRRHVRRNWLGPQVAIA